MPIDPASQAVVLSSGGVRSLVALALTRAEEETAERRLTLLHVHDGRPSRKRAADAAARQADAFAVDRTAELTLSHARDRGIAEAPPPPGADLAGVQIVLAAACHAARRRVARVVYGVSTGADDDAAARTTEQLLLIEQLAATSAQAPPGSNDREAAEANQLPGAGVGAGPRIETPLLELTDQQVVELGGQLGVDFALSWSCLADAPQPCQACVGCRRRRDAFDKAGVVDPLFQASQAAA